MQSYFLLGGMIKDYGKGLGGDRGNLEIWAFHLSLEATQ